MRKLKGTPVPNSGTIEKVYFNTELSNEEVVATLDTIIFKTAYEQIYGNPMYCVCSNSNKTFNIFVSKVDGKYSIYYQNGTEGNTKVFENNMWMSFYDNPVIMNITAYNQEQGSPLPIGEQNDNLSSLFSIKEFESVEEKKIQMHPTDENGELDKSVYLYPITKAENLIDVEFSEETSVNGKDLQTIKFGNDVWRIPKGSSEGSGGESGSETYTNTTPTPASLGGIKKGDTFENKTYKEMFDMLLYPYVAFSFSFSTVPNGGTYEIGTNVSVTSANVNITLGSAEISKIEIYEGSTLLATKTSGITSGNNSIAINVVVSANRYFTAKVTDSTGKQISNNSNYFTFVNAYYVGKIDDGVEISESVITSGVTNGNISKVIVSKASKTYSFTLNQQKAVYAYPKSYGSLTSIKDSNGFDVIGGFIKHELQIGGVDYYLYELSDIATLTMKYTFNY